ncbi:MAG: Transcription antitermination protein NusB [Mycoplasmataceae bacterium]|nr:MAG: Transcription antitermination protein NusB [Mycoplasmataceae bacterium]
MFRFDKRKIFLLYYYYLINSIPNDSEENEIEKGRFVWLDKCLKKEELLKEKINSKLKTGWEFSQLPPLERSILIYSVYELIFGKNKDLEKMIIDQTINFSKVYLDKEKFKYINKLLDLTIKEK